MLVGPVFSAGSVTSERERETLDLLLTTILSPGQILWAKLVSGPAGFQRADDVSAVAAAAGRGDGQHLLDATCRACWATSAIVLVVCLTTATVALFCSVMFRKTSISLMTTYLVIVVLFTAAAGGDLFRRHVFSRTRRSRSSSTRPASPARLPRRFNLPIDLMMPGDTRVNADWTFVAAFAGFYAILDGVLLAAMAWLFNVRWRMAE